MKKRLIVGNTLIAITALYILVNPVGANAITTPPQLWEQVANKLGVGKDKVITAVEQIRSDRQKEHLSQLVKDGKLTQAQADSLLVKQKEWQVKREALKAERDAWFKSQNIDPSLFSGPRHMEGKGSRGGMPRGMR